jgi:hypothetical protein
MAYSPYQDTVYILEFINNLNPRSILDVGAGFGRWGFLCRCHFAGGTSLAIKPGQTLQIDAVEAFEPNVNPVYSAVYNRTFLGDAREVLQGLGEYDVIICSHMIEHLEKPEGWDLIETMRKRARMALILGLPFNDPLREPIEGNEFEAHRSVWTAGDFHDQQALVRSFRFLKRTDAGVVIYPCDDNARWHVKTLRNPLRTLAVRHCPKALRWLRCMTGHPE